MLTLGQYTHHPWCPHLIATLQRVVDEVSMPMWMPGPCSGTTPILVRGPSGSRAGAAAAPAPQVEVYPTQYGDVVQVIIPPTVYETVRALGYHHLGDLYTEDHGIKGERTLKEQAPACKGVPGLRAWLAMPSWRPYRGCPRRGGRLRPRTGSRAPCLRTRRKWLSEAGWARPPGWRPCTTGAIRSR